MQSEMKRERVKGGKQSKLRKCGDKGSNAHMIGSRPKKAHGSRAKMTNQEPYKWGISIHC